MLKLRLKRSYTTLQWALTMPMSGSRGGAGVVQEGGLWKARRTGSLPRKLKAMLDTPPLILLPGHTRLISRVALQGMGKTVRRCAERN